MAERTEPAPNLAVFLDYENIAIGLRDASAEGFGIDLVLGRLLDKGKIVVKKAYADWGRYGGAKRPLHEAAFDLIDIPSLSYSGKNSADIRLVVDALDLCYTNEHVGVFVIISGDSDFSPLASKLRENDKKVIGLGVKNSTSEMLIANCDEFVYYDDLVRERGSVKKAPPKTEPKARAGNRAESEPSESEETLKVKALQWVIDTAEALLRERGEAVWGSMVKQTLKRKRPEFSESYHGYRSFNQLLEDAGKRGLLDLQKDQKSGGYVIAGLGPSV